MTLLQSAYIRGLALLTIYLCFELAAGILIAGHGRDDAIIARVVIVGGTLVGLIFYSQFARYAGSILILAANAYTAFVIVSNLAAKGLSAGKAGPLLTFLIWGQVLFSIAAALYLLSPIFGREFVAFRNNPEQRTLNINIHPRIYQIATAIVLLAAIVSISGDIKRIVQILSNR